MCVCYVFAIFRTFRATELKLGTELEFHLEKDIAIMRAGPTHPGGGPGALNQGPRFRTAKTVRFWDNYIRQKLKSALDLVGASQVRSGPGPHPGVRRLIQVQGEGLLPWSNWMRSWT